MNTSTYSGKNFGFHITRDGGVYVLTRPATHGRGHLASAIYAGHVYRDGLHWRRTDSDFRYDRQSEAAGVCAAVKRREISRAVQELCEVA